MTSQQVDVARSKGFELYACNNAIIMAPDAALLYAVNYRWWKHYHEQVKTLPCEKWTTNRLAADEFGLNWIAEKNAPGLSQDRDIIHHGHGSGFSLVSMAYRNGAKRIILLGYDLKYSQDYDGRNRQPGSAPRHFFGEYPSAMQHWPTVKVKNGVHVELVEMYREVKRQGLVEIINATPDSAIDCFDQVEIEAV